ncbi:hypothetical protein SLEP1_g52925 [Rubroshorea leprosula]|uniref:Aspergillus nuclease S1 n=1 Tax=Rubroshorea leprosula TaxID=152421 RepID=A0AAV5M8R6_9ROSI|nr:hypothetical protein SLEP1_g52925 [Rubroshorea leprosula]
MDSRMGRFRIPSSLDFVLLVGLALILIPRAQAWSKEGHALTCQIAQSLLEQEAAEAVANLLPHNVNGDLSALCTWPDQIRHWYKYRWTSSLHFIDTPDGACNYDYERDCHDLHGVGGMCVAGAIQNFTLQLLHYREGTADRRCKESNSKIFVWDREIILTALKDYYDKDLDSLMEAITGNITDGIWADDVPSWGKCDDLLPCLNQYASESVKIACKWGYKGVKSGDTLADEYFNSRMPIVMKRIAQGGVRLAMILNSVFGDSGEGFAAAT